MISHLNFRQPSGKCSPYAPFSPDLPFLSNLPFSSIIEATGPLLTSHLNFHQFSFSPSLAFLDINAFLSYFKTLNSSPTLEIEPTAYCWFTRDITASNIGDQEQKCRSPLGTTKVLLITNVSTLSHDCKLSVRTSA